MKVRMLASAPEFPHEHQFLTSFVIDDRLAIDAGCVGFCGAPDDQSKIDHVFLTHSHADHICSLPMLVMNGYEGRDDGVVVHGNEHVLECLRTDVFNDRVWPDFVKLSEHGPSLLHVDQIEAEQSVEVGGLTITPVAVEHLVPTFGYVVDDDESTVVFCPDTAPTERIWEVAGQRANLKAIFLGAAFPEDMAEMARISAHLVPSQFRREIEKVGREATVVAIHIKPRYRQQIIRELEGLEIESLEIGVFGKEYTF